MTWKAAKLAALCRLVQHAVASPACPIVFDGRVPSNTSLAQFDTTDSIFNPSFILGANQKFSKVLRFPAEPGGSLFDRPASAKAVEVTINDKSIFSPSPSNIQAGFRRTELLIASNSGKDDSTVGARTLHFSIAKDVTRPLNLAHEYQLCFLEDAAFSNNQFVLKTGTIIGVNNVTADALTLFGNTDNFGDVLFSTPFTEDHFHNFALALDFDTNKTQVFYSTGLDPLRAVTRALSNNIGGQGQYHFGVLKKGLDGNGDPNKGTQEADIDEGVIYGGIFMEDSSDGCRTLI